MSDGDDEPDAPAGDEPAGPGDGGKRKRRRRRRGGGEGAAEPVRKPDEGAVAAQPAAEIPAQAAAAPPKRDRGPQRQQPVRNADDQRGARRSDEQRGARRSDEQRGAGRSDEQRGAGRSDEQHGRDRSAPAQPTAREDHEEAATEPAISWGRDDDTPAAAVTLGADLPLEPAADPDPLTVVLLEQPSIQLGDDVASVVAVRFVPAGRTQWFDAGDADVAVGDRVLVDSDRGPRLAWVAVAPTRKPTRDRGLRRLIRRATEQDLRGERDGDTDRVRFLRLAKDAANKVVDRDQRPLMKVYRVELQGTGRGGKLIVYYTSDDRLDLREFLRELSAATSARIELRQLGVRDEAKAIGGIGSCGLTLCCTTWLPDFVPVSIKMAKDQGLVLSPTKVSGQCGRLKCCLVYEQAGYAELRKGLPKLGKRVISQRGEGRVVEVDVLRQRVRVSYGAGETELLPAAEVRPLFPSGNRADKAADDEHDDHDEPSPTDDTAPSDV